MNRLQDVTSIDTFVNRLYFDFYNTWFVLYLNCHPFFISDVPLPPDNFTFQSTDVGREIHFMWSPADGRFSPVTGI